MEEEEEENNDEDDEDEGGVVGATGGYRIGNGNQCMLSYTIV